MDLRERREKLEKLAKLTGPQVEVMYYRCLDKDVAEITDILQKENEGTVWARFTRIFRILEITGEEALVSEYCPIFQEFIKSEDDWKDWGNIRSKILREAWDLAAQAPAAATELPKAGAAVQSTSEQSATASQVGGEVDSQQNTGDTDQTRSRGSVPPWFLIAIPLLLACVVCGFLGWRIVIPIIQNALAPAQATESPALQIPTETTAPPLTDTPPVLPTETSLPTSTNTALLPTSTSQPTNTSLPTETATPSIPDLFFDNFDNGKSDKWQVIYGSEPVIVNGALTFNDTTLMIIEAMDWTDYEVSFYVSNMRCQEFVGSEGLNVGMRVQDASNMVALRINDEDYCGGTWMLIENNAEEPFPNTNFKLPPVDNNGGRQLVLRVQGNNYSTPIGTSIVIENYPAGGVALLGERGVTVDNFRVTPLTP